MKSPVISIIVPIYNMDSYLRRCLDSLLAQTMTEIEIIAVNDGSTDTSLKILSDYKRKDERIIIINKENEGVSAARNDGISLAKGEFIGFVDPDDWVSSDMYENLYQRAKNGTTDIIMCSYFREFGTHSKEKKFNLSDLVTYEESEIKKTVLRKLVGPINEEKGNPELLDAWGTVWTKLYRAELLKENEIRFTNLSEIGTNEDLLFNIEAFFYAKNFEFINAPFYHYWRENNNSVTSGYKPHLMDQWFTLFNKIESFFEKQNMNMDIHLALNNRICIGTLGLGLNTISKANVESHAKKMRKINNILKDQRIKQAFEHFDLSHFPLIWKVFYFCAKTKSSVSFYFLLLAIERLRKIVR